MHDVVISPPRARARRQLPPCSSDAPASDKRRSAFALSAPAWIAPCDIRIILLASIIKLALRAPSRNLALKLEVLFCVRGVYTPDLSNNSKHIHLRNMSSGRVKGRRR